MSLTKTKRARKIRNRPAKRPKRKSIPDRVLIVVLLRELGVERKDVEFHHDPPLALREQNARKTDTIPPANDPAHIKMLFKFSEHRPQTFGSGATVAGSDIGNINKAKRVLKERLEREKEAKQNRNEKLAKLPLPERKRPFYQDM